MKVKTRLKGMEQKTGHTVCHDTEEVLNADFLNQRTTELVDDRHRIDEPHIVRGVST